MKLRTSIIRVIIVAIIVTLCFVFGSCTPAHNEKVKPVAIVKDSTDLIVKANEKVFKINLKIEQENIDTVVYVQARDKYDAERMADNIVIKNEDDTCHVSTDIELVLINKVKY